MRNRRCYILTRKIGSNLRWSEEVLKERRVKGGYVYIMASGPHGTLYVGVTANLPRRIWEHKEGIGSQHCRDNGCTILVHIEHFPTIEEAIAREKAMKAWKRRWKTEMISRNNPEWRDLYDGINK